MANGTEGEIARESTAMSMERIRLELNVGAPGVAHLITTTMQNAIGIDNEIGAVDSELFIPSVEDKNSKSTSAIRESPDRQTPRATRCHPLLAAYRRSELSAPMGSRQQEKYTETEISLKGYE